MLNLMLIAFQEYLLSPARIAGLSLIIIGIATVFIAKKLTRVIKKQSLKQQGGHWYESHSYHCNRVAVLLRW